MATTPTRAGRRVSSAVDTAEIGKLESTLRGRIVRPSDKEYDQARSIWNAMIDRRPALIVQAAGVPDIKQAVDFARQHNMLISIKGGGHSVAGHSVCDDGLMLDLSRLKQVHVDPNNRTATVEPGVTLAEFDRAAQAHGLATPLGVNSTTGVAGLTLGGGFGWLSRKYGYTVDNLLSAEMILANGEFVTASEQENPDLFWAIRGGGGNFGVVTKFTFRLHQVGPEILAGLVVYPIEDAVDVLKKWREFSKSLPVDTVVWPIGRQAPPLPFLPEDIHGQPILAFAIFHSGDIEQGRKNVEPVRHFGTPVGEMIDTMPYVNWQSMFDAMQAPGGRNYWKSHNLKDVPDELLENFVRYAQTLPSPEFEVLLIHLAGAPNKKPQNATAYPHRETEFLINVHGRWQVPSQDEKCFTWSRNFIKETAKYSSGGVYVNFLTEDETDRTHGAFGPSYDRLVEIKRKYDPENLFCMNQNIDPKG